MIEMRKLLHRLFCQRRCTLTKAIVGLAVCFVLFLAYNHHSDHWMTKNEPKLAVKLPPLPASSCDQLHNRQLGEKGPNEHYFAAKNQKISKKVLIIVESPYSRNAKNIAYAMESARFQYKVVSDSKTLPTLTHTNRGRFGVIIFETMNIYLNLEYWSRQLIDKYCSEFGVGMIFFMKGPSEEDLHSEKIVDFGFTVQYNIGLKEYKLNPNSEVWRITKPGEIVGETFQEEGWAVFHINHTTFEPLALATQTASFYEDYEPVITSKSKIVYPAVLDRGLNDGIRRVFFGQDFSFWLHSLMLMDSISYLSYGKLSLSLERFIQIDIDDIFVGAIGTRMKAEDVVALADAQRRLGRLVEGFHFMLGFSGWYFQHGNEQENEGDSMLLIYKDHFHWFPHMWRHEQPHKFNEEDLVKNMKLNYQFAKDNNLSVSDQYAVAPHHSGVFPVHDSLYTAWKSIWDIRVTSTEEYPRLNPAAGRRGFVHRGIMVLPRQTCGLFTHTYILDAYPGGRERLEKSIRGGVLFNTFLYNPLNIYMTHLSNYGNDRLALYTFESVIKFVTCWTNLKLKQGSPMDHAMKYFDLFPDEETPIWRNPCDYEKHIEIWSVNKTCNKFPKFLVVGPQKTGTTALYTFLGMHPSIQSNMNSENSFEELQFFNGNNYLNGIDWYLDHFPQPKNVSGEYLFEKSAAYFDNSIVPKRAHALLPNAKIICILIHPAKRAYSWYQHMRAHNDKVAMNYTFQDIVTSSDSAPREVKSLRNRCLNPGAYAYHLENWLDYYSSRQILILDGDSLKDDPVTVMEKVQKFLGVEKYLDYSKVLRFDNKKGFYCQVLSTGASKCLGRSKGRQYPPMDPMTEEYLQNFYRKYNTELAQLLDQLHVEKPAWLEQEMKQNNASYKKR